MAGGSTIRALLAFALTLGCAAPAFANIGRVKIASGSAHVERGGAKLPVKPGFIVLAGDTLVVPAKSRMGATFVDNSRVSLGPNSRLAVRTFEYNDTTEEGRFRADLQRGTVLIASGNIPRSGPRAMEIRTRRNIFAIRGARVVIEVK